MRNNKLLVYSGKWWVPFSFWAFTFLLFNVGELAKVEIIQRFSFQLLIVGMAALFISIIYQFSKRKWLGAVLSLFAFAGTFIFFTAVAIVMFVSDTVDGDKWADNLKIPANIVLHKPIKFDYSKSPDGFIVKRSDSILNAKRSTTDFELYCSFQPGLYEYDFWTGGIESGSIYLKVFEITRNYALSTDRLPETTLVSVFNPTDKIEKFGTTELFTIYEGDWGKPYAARFEVWYKPDDGGNEKKLLEKNYIIEGWMR